MAYNTVQVDETPSNVLPVGKAGAAFVVGTPVYMDSSGVWQKAQAVALGSTSRKDALGFVWKICQANQDIDPVKAIHLRGFTGLTIGAKVYLSSTAGEISATEPTAEVRQVLGFACSASEYFLDAGVADAGIDVGGDVNVDTLIAGGTALTYLTHNIYSNSTSASTDAANTVEPNLFVAEMTGAAGLGRAVRATLNVTNVALGAWSNAIKGLIDFKTSGSVAGLGSAICAEMVMCGGAMAASGTYGVLELELVCPTSWSGGNKVSFIYAEVSGATKANFDTYGYLLNLQGVSVGAGKIFDTCVATPASHALRIMIGSTPYYIMLTDNVDDT